jgi:hypothetical protein
MKILIFGRGIIAETKYLPYLFKAYSRENKTTELQLYFVDKNKENCFEVENWENEPRLPVKEIRKVIILSPPNAHLLNFESIVNKFLSRTLQFPEIYIEKPIYLESEKNSWLKILKMNPILENKVFYIDHYRFKDSIDFFLEDRKNILDALGPIKEIAFVSLEKQKFWDSSAFSFGYFLEHGCHFFGMLDRAFPEIRGCDFVPDKINDWKKWEQSGRPSKCKEDSSVLLYLKIRGSKDPLFAKFIKVTIIIGKGLIDNKVLYVEGEKGYLQFFFNENRNIIKTSTLEKTVIRTKAKESYERVIENIFTSQNVSVLLNPLEKGIADQENVIKIRSYFPKNMGKYNYGEIPVEIKRELLRLKVGD